MTDLDRICERAKTEPGTVEPRALARALRSTPGEAITVGNILRELDESDGAGTFISQIGRLLEDSDSDLRASAALALATCFSGNTKATASVPVQDSLVSLLSDEYYVARKHAGMAVVAIAQDQPRAAIRAVSDIPVLLDPSSPSLFEQGSKLASRVVEADPEVATALFDPMLSALIETASKASVRESLAQQGSNRLVSHASYQDRERASASTNYYRDQLAMSVRDLVSARPAAGARVVEEIREALDEVEAGSVRVPLTEAIAQIADDTPDAAVCTIDTLASQLDDDCAIAANSARALGAIADAAPRQVAAAAVAHVDRLTVGLNTEDAGVRTVSAGLLAYIGEYHADETDTATDELVSRLDDENAHVRASAALALGYISSTNTVGPLRVSAANDPVGKVKETARTAIERIEDEAGRE